MKYYLSCYLSPPGTTAIITPRHDQNVALWRCDDTVVELVRFWELERLSGQKHHFWPLFSERRVTRLLEELLASEGLTLADITAVWGTEGLPKSAELPIPVGADHLPVHSLAHLYSGLLLDSRLFKTETIVALALDGGPDFGLDRRSKDFWYAGCVSVRGQISFSAVESPGAFYDAARALFGKEPGTLMALATACSTTIEFDTAEAMASVALFGGSTPPLTYAMPFLEGLIEAARHQLARSAATDDRFSEAEHLQAAVMKVVQEAAEIMTARTIDRLIDTAGIDPAQAYLSLSGGFALNCPTNSYLLDRYGFKGLLIPPCANDSGQALGMGLLAFSELGRLDRAEFVLGSAYHGAEIDDVDAALSQFDRWVERVDDFDGEQFARDLVAAPVVWVDGAAEIGPRALGHRSILADPRTERSKDLLNEYKNRQWWRPVAPIVLAESTGDWFVNDWGSPYMLETTAVLEARKALVPAIVHLDGSARHQTLARADDPLLHRAISAFGEHTGVPIVCNTSLNDQGEPIVQSAAEALNFAVRKGIRVAYLAGRRVLLRAGREHRSLVGPHPRSERIFAGQEAERDRLWADLAAQGYSETAIFLLSRAPELRDARAVRPAHVTRLGEISVRGDATGSLELAVKRHLARFGPGSVFVPGDADHSRGDQVRTS